MFIPLLNYLLIRYQRIDIRTIPKVESKAKSDIVTQGGRPTTQFRVVLVYGPAWMSRLHCLRWSRWLVDWAVGRDLERRGARNESTR